MKRTVQYKTSPFFSILRNIYMQRMTRSCWNICLSKIFTFFLVVPSGLKSSSASRSSMANFDVFFSAFWTFPMLPLFSFFRRKLPIKDGLSSSDMIGWRRSYKTCFLHHWHCSRVGLRGCKPPLRKLELKWSNLSQSYNVFLPTLLRNLRQIFKNETEKHQSLLCHVSRAKYCLTNWQIFPRWLSD